ncbi:MAG: biotin/lipoyl-containing protein [Dysgonamonadaceae bacterium]
MKEFTYKINGKEYKVAVEKENENNIELKVNGKPYTVEVENKPAPKLAPPKKASAASAAKATSASAAITAAPPTASSSKKAVKSPLPGTIIDIKVEVGDSVKKGQTVIILEAMKMENNVNASSDGVVTKILVSKTDTVGEGDTLIEIG